VVNQAVIKNYNNRQRYNFTDVQVVKKPSSIRDKPDQ